MPTHDNTMAQASRKCLRWYYIRHILGLRAKGDLSPALAFGSLMHDALAIWYRTFDIDQALQLLMDAPYKVPESDYRTRGRAITTMYKYAEYYGEEPQWKILFTESAVDVEDPEDGFRWGGRLDLGVAWNNSPWVVDHKTTSVGTTRWWTQFKMSPQMSGYTWAGSQLHGSPLKGAIINRLTIQKKEKPPEVEFSRKHYLYRPWMLDEWKQQMIEEYHRIHEARQTDHFPPNWHACHGKYGTCEAHTICTDPPKGRDRSLNYEFEHDPWDWTDDV